MSTDPFLTMIHGHPCGAVDAQGRIDMVKRFNHEQCESALKIEGLQKSVEQAVHSRLRKLAKDGE